MFTGPVGPVEVFLLALIYFVNFYWPGTVGPLLASGSGACFSYRKVRIVRNLRFVNLGTFLRRSVIAFLEALRK